VIKHSPGLALLLLLLPAAASSPLAAADYYTVTPCRLFDSRTGQIVGNNDARTVQVTGACGVPLTATAASLNVTVIPGRPGYLTLYPSGESAPATSTVNFSLSQTRSNNAVVKLGTNGAITMLLVSGSFGAADVIVDVNGYFQ
jgi:hypothetical protein